MGDRALSHLEKYKKFYEENDLKFQEDFDGIPRADGVDCLCDNPKGCGYSCHSGEPCEKFKPNKRFYKRKVLGIATDEIDYEKDYFAPVKNPLELKIEALEERIRELENLKK